MNIQVIPIVEQCVIEHLRSQVSFTALDISNALKTQHYPVTHVSVAEIVRDIYQSGAMSYYDFDRRLIDVVTQGGTKKTRAFLYLHNEARGQDYIRRNQNSLPAVSPDQARHLPLTVAAASLVSQPKAIVEPSLPGRRSGRGKSGRRDGAFAVPRKAVALLGWQAGDILTLDSQSGRIILQLMHSHTPCDMRIWKEQRLRICRSKMEKAQLQADDVSLLVGDHCLTLTARS